MSSPEILLLQPFSEINYEIKLLSATAQNYEGEIKIYTENSRKIMDARIRITFEEPSISLNRDFARFENLFIETVYIIKNSKHPNVLSIKNTSKIPIMWRLEDITVDNVNKLKVEFWPLNGVLDVDCSHSKAL